MLQFVLGVQEETRTQWLYDQIAKRLQDGQPSWILVPEQFSLFMEKEILRRFGLPAQSHVKVLSFSRLCNLVLQHKGPLRMQYIDGAGKQILAAHALKKLDGKLTSLQRNLKQKGFSSVLVDTISECKRYGVSPQALWFAAENTKQEDFSAKLQDLALLYETYDELLTAQSADAEDNLTMICPRLRACEFLQGALFVLHFRSFTPVEYQALGELMTRMDVTVALEYSNHPSFAGLFAPVETTMRRLQEIAENLQIEEAPKAILSFGQEHTALACLGANYFNPTARPWEGACDSIFLCEATNTHQELEYAADTILRLCRTQNLRFSDFLILARDVESYRRMIPMIFGRRGIRVFLDTRRSVAEKPLVRLIYGILEILAYGYSYERVMKLARCELFPLSRPSIDALENYILAVAPGHAMWQAEVWDYVPGKNRFDMEDINRTKDVLFSGVKMIEAQISGIKTGAELAGAMLNWLKDSGITRRMEENAQSALNAGQPELADEYQQTWNAVLSVLSQISSIMADTPMTYRQFAELFETACDGISIGMTPQTIDCVTFSQIDRFRSSGAKAVLVLGMNEGVFPRGFMTEGLLSDSERQAMADLGVELAPGKESKRKEEQLLIYAVLTAAKEQLWFFRPLLSRDAKRTMPSVVLHRVQELFPTLAPYQPGASDPLLQSVEGAFGAFDLLASALAQYGGMPEYLPLPLQELYGWFRNEPTYHGALEKLQAAMTAQAPTQLSAEMVKALYGAPLSLSASQLEAFNSCAFRYFLTYGLLLKERELAGLEPRSKGSIQHAALYSYFMQLKQNDVDFATVTKEDCFSQIGAMVKEESKKNAELLYETSAYYQYIVMQMQGIAARTAWEVVKFYQSGSFRPYGFEITIGTQGDIPAISVKDTAGKELAKIRGLIDRADMARVNDTTLLSVIDYKSSAKNLDVQLAADGITLQPLLYADALRKSMDNATPVALMYLQMTDPILAEKDARGNVEHAINQSMRPLGWVADDAETLTAYGKPASKGDDSFLPPGKSALISREDLQARIDAANERIVQSAAAIAGGDIGVKPYRTDKHDACTYCLYSGVCQRELCENAE